MKNKHFNIESFSLDFSCQDFDGGQWLDTMVFINGEYLVTIAGSDIDNFVNDFKAILTKYRI